VLFDRDQSPANPLTEEMKAQVSVIAADIKVNRSLDEGRNRRQSGSKWAAPD